MTTQETAQIMTVIHGAYPNWKADKDSLAVWAALFAEDDAAQVAAAVKSFIATDINGYPPNIGQIKQILTRSSVPAMTEGEAWAIIRKAISNGIYGSYQEFEALPPILKRVVGSPEQLEQWAMVTSGLDTVIASTVKRDYLNTLEQERSSAALPEAIRNALPGKDIKALMQGGQADDTH